MVNEVHKLQVLEGMSRTMLYVCTLEFSGGNAGNLQYTSSVKLLCAYDLEGSINYSNIPQVTFKYNIMNIVLIWLQTS